MKITYLIILYFLFVTFTSSAQSVTVLDSVQKSPISGATIIIYNVSTGKIEKQGITNANGIFATSAIESHILYMSISAIGYKKTTLQQTQEKEIILLTPDPKQLKEVKITTNKSPVKFNGNIMEYDISQVSNADYLNLSDIIDHLPFLQVTIDGKIKMMDENLKILIDNQPNAIYKDASSLKIITTTSYR